MELKLTCIFMLVVLLPNMDVGAKKVLLVPTQINSHVFEMVEAVRDLMTRGHEVYITLGHTFTKMDRVRKSGIKPLVFTTTAKHSFEELTRDLPFASEFKLSHANDASKRILHDCESMVYNEEFMNTLKNLKFDLALVDGFPLSFCSFIVPKVINVPFVYQFSDAHPWEIGVPALPSFVPLSAFPLSKWHFTDNMSFQQRLVNTGLFMMAAFVKPLDGQSDPTLLKKFAPEYSSWESLAKQAELFIITRNYILEFPMPTLPNVIYLPGITVDAAKPLEGQFKKLIDDIDGFILVSFGSLANEIPTQITERLVTAFNQFTDITIIWKVGSIEREDFPSMKPNIHIFKWLPQNDLLGHPKLRVFVTHCGNNGQHEAVYHGVPMVGLPLSAEQPHNSFRMAAHGFGVHVDAGLRAFKPDELANAIREVKNNDTYRINVAKAGRILKDSPMTPSQTVAYWLEHIMKFGSDHLRSHSLHMPLYQVFMLDIVALVLLVLLLAVYITRLILHTICRWFCSGKIKQE